MSLDLGAAQLAGRLQQTPPSTPSPPPADRGWRHLRALGLPGGHHRCLADPAARRAVIDERTIASPAQIAVPRRRADPGRNARSATLVSLQRVALGFLIGGVGRPGPRHRRRAVPHRRGRRRPADADAPDAAALRADPAVHHLDGDRRGAQARADRHGGRVPALPQHLGRDPQHRPQDPPKPRPRWA